MRNPWLSLWLSAANAWAGAMRGFWTAELHRQQTAAANPPRRINELVQGKRAVSADTDLRLARYFGLSEGFFLGLQATTT